MTILIIFFFFNLHQQLAEFARRRAIQLATKDGTNFYHPDDLPYGENLAWNSQEPIDCSLPLKLWYDEWKIYNFQRPNINPRNGHFTQMVCTIELCVFIQCVVSTFHSLFSTFIT